MLALRTKFAQAATKSIVRPAPRRWFSVSQQPQGPGIGTMLGVGVGTAGLMYLMYQSRTLNQ